MNSNGDTPTIRRAIEENSAWATHWDKKARAARLNKDWEEAAKYEERANEARQEAAWLMAEAEVNA